MLFTFLQPENLSKAYNFTIFQEKTKFPIKTDENATTENFVRDSVSLTEVNRAWSGWLNFQQSL